MPSRAQPNIANRISHNPNEGHALGISSKVVSVKGHVLMRSVTSNPWFLATQVLNGND